MFILSYVSKYFIQTNAQFRRISSHFEKGSSNHRNTMKLSHTCSNKKGGSKPRNTHSLAPTELMPNWATYCIIDRHQNSVRNTPCQANYFVFASSTWKIRGGKFFACYLAEELIIDKDTAYILRLL